MYKKHITIKNGDKIVMKAVVLFGENNTSYSIDRGNGFSFVSKKRFDEIIERSRHLGYEVCEHEKESV